MKTYKFLFPLIIIIALFVSSCMEDNSTRPTHEIEGVVIDTTGMSSFDIIRNDTLEITPNVLTELDESRLSYEWKISNFGLQEVISRKKKLAYKVTLLPNNGSSFYRLALIVTDNKTGLEYIMVWQLYVLNNLGEGLVVASTIDGNNTDLGLIMAPRITDGYSKISVKHHLFSTVNQRTIQGLINDMQYTRFGGSNTRALLAITDHSIVRVNTLDYKFAGKNQELFFSHPAEFSPQMVGLGSYDHIFYVEDGKLTAIRNISKKFGLPRESSYTVPGIIASNFTIFPTAKVSFYDEEHGRFVYIEAFSPFYNNEMQPVPTDNSGAFNPADLPNNLNVAAGVSSLNSSGNFVHLLKNKITGKYVLYVLSGGENDPVNPIPPAPIALFDLSGAPEIQNAHEFVLADNQKVMYYATDHKIYAVMYGGQTPAYELRYTAPTGETITTLQLYYQVGYTTNGNWLDTNGMQLVMSTYDGSEGKVYLLPITNLGVGLIDEANIVSFGGFGKVTAITPQE